MCGDLISSIFGGGDNPAKAKAALATDNKPATTNAVVLSGDSSAGLSSGSVTGRNKNDPTKRIAVPGLVL